ncbi:MAG: class I SAM-dependent methyltransferase [Microscillaceae bacterium]|nr:class I SAM-dependent methyltransferase [Microscillaceae bacterium]
MLETLQECPVCLHRDFVPFLSCRDFTVTQEEFNLVNCTHCGFTFTNPRPDEGSIAKYYQSESYISHSNTRKGLINQIYHFIRQRALKNKLKLIDNLQKDQKIQDQSSKKLLDYGCGTGDFLHTCLLGGWQIEGLEPDPKARAQAAQITQTEIREHIFEPYFNGKQLDIITLWHVLEHVHRLDETLERLRSMVKPGGNLVIAVPNLKGWEAGFFKEFWAAYDVPRHLYHFSPVTMKKLLAKHRMKILRKLPMPYDAYYVSLLSNQYQFGRMKYMKSFLEGYYSNRQAAKSGNYSSLIYTVELLK